MTITRVSGEYVHQPTAMYMQLPCNALRQLETLKVRTLMHALLRLTTVVGILAWSWTATASTNACRPPDWVIAANDAGHYCRSCECPKTSKKYPVKVASGFKFIAVCGDDAVAGPFFFLGNKSVSGHVVLRETMTYGEQLTFEGYTFENQAEAIRKLKAPELNGQVSCWRAKATIRVNSYFEYFSDTDFQGTFLQSYDVLKVETFKRCKGEVAAF